VKDFLIASIFASCAFCVAVSAAQHATPLPATASARPAADPLQAHVVAPSFDVETSPPQREPGSKPAPSADHVELLSAD